MNSNIPPKLVKVHFLYSQSTIPPGCRKPRAEVKRDGEIIVEIACPTSADAPVALKATGNSRVGAWAVEYRWFQGQLWAAVNTNIDGSPSARTSGGSDFRWPVIPDVIDIRQEYFNDFNLLGMVPQYAVDGRDETEAAIRAWAKSEIVIDGDTYRPTYERCYEIATFGLGGNFGGTAVFSSSSGRGGRQFSLLERERVLEEATEVARIRGDTGSLPMAVNGDVNWEVLMPEVLTVRAGLKAYRVHLNAVVRVPVEIDAAGSQLEAIDLATDRVDLYGMFSGHSCEYAEEIVSVLVDEVGDSDHLHSRFYDPGTRPEQGTWVLEKATSFPRGADLSREIGFLDEGRDQGFPRSAEGYAAHAAVKELAGNWADAIRDGYSGNLLSDIDTTVALLMQFKERAKAILPAQVTQGA
ncbi:hypothetical protein QZM25_30805 [Burkholderia contaminans]|uniref:hypothetical protein n=1 Tax=Burkholderia contaminans TaxID=488447 RepID=UPI001CF5AD8F|nr:hypothetical protein [Burkholderia contaminans]MCA7889133.1 hypothetical protein [Burkholderia contaminans]MDN7577005.1 hypothetical protein [Burkholderia contaminans]